MTHCLLGVVVSLALKPRYSDNPRLGFPGTQAILNRPESWGTGGTLQGRRQGTEACTVAGTVSTGLPRAATRLFPCPFLPALRPDPGGDYSVYPERLRFTESP